MRGRIFLLIIFLTSTLLGCKKYPWDNCDVGEGDLFEDSRNFANFHTFALDIPAEIVITPDTNLSSSRIVVFAQKNVSEKIDITNSEGIVRVRFSGCFKSHKDIRFHLYTPWLQYLQLNSTSNVSSTQALFGEHFTIEANAGTSLDMSFKLDSLVTIINNAGTFTMNGYSDRNVVVNNSTGRYLSSDMISDSAIVAITSSGYVNTYVTGHLIANVSGNGLLEFSGEDTLHLDTTITGAGSIVDLR